RALLALLLEDAARALDALRAMAEQRWPEPSERAPAKTRRHNSSRPPFAAEPELEPEPLIHVAASTVDVFAERLERFGVVEDELYRAAEVARRIAVRLREVRANLLQATRWLSLPSSDQNARQNALIRIEAATHAVRASAANADRGAVMFRRQASFLHVRT